jgi:hypothetical protein
MTPIALTRPSDFEQALAGTYIARLVRIIDLGAQRSTFNATSAARAAIRAHHAGRVQVPAPMMRPRGRRRFSRRIGPECARRAGLTVPITATPSYHAKDKEI